MATTHNNNVVIGASDNKLNIKNSVISDTSTIDAYEIVTDAASGLRIGAGTTVASNPEWINDFMIAFERNNGVNTNIKIKNSTSSIEIKPTAITFSADYFNFTTPTTGSIVLRGLSAYNDYTQINNDIEFKEEVTAKKNIQVDQNLTVGKLETTGNQNVDLYADVFIRGDLSLNGNLNLQKNSIKPEYIDSELGADYTVDICMNEALIVGGDVSFHNKLDVGGATTFNGLVTLNDATIMRGNVYAAQDLHIYGNLKVDHVENQSTYNIAQTNYQVVTVDELSLNGRMFVQDDASFNGDVYIKDNLTVDGNINGISSVQMGHLTTITDNVQTQLNNATSAHQSLTDNKHDKITNISKLSASLIGTSGLVTNSHFDALEGVSSNIQNQLDTLSASGVDYDVDIHMTKSLTVDGDTTINGNLKATQITNEYIINTTTSNYALIVTEDLSLNGKILIQDDASFNKDVYVKDNLSVDGNVNGISKNKFGYLSNISSDIQDQLNINANSIVNNASSLLNKQDKITTTNKLSADLVGDGLVTNEKFGYLSGVTSNIQTQLDNASADYTVDICMNKTLTVGGDASFNNNVVVDGNINGVSKVQMGYLSNISSDIQNQLNINAGSIVNNTSQITTLQASTISVDNKLSASWVGTGTVDNDKFGYLSGVTSDIQNQLNTNAGSIVNNTSQITTLQASTISVDNKLSASWVGTGTVDNAKFGYLSGVTSDIQTQLDNASADYNVDICMNKTLTIGGDASFNNDVKIDGILTVDIDKVPTWNQATTGNAATATTADTATTAATVTDSTQSAITKLGTLIDLEVEGDVTINGNIKADKITNDYIINTETTNYTLMVAEDLSLNGKLFVLEDASLNSNLSVAGTINNITNDEISYLSGVTSNIQTQINNASTDFTIDICMNKTLTVGGDVSLNSDLIISGNLTVDTDKVPTWNQNTTGNAATSTTATTADSVLYSGLTGTVPTWNQNTTGNAATSTTATTADSVLYSGLTGTVPIWNQNTTGNADTATTAASADSVPYTGLTGTVTTWNQNTTGSATTVTNPTQSAITTLGTLTALDITDGLHIINGDISFNNNINGISKEKLNYLTGVTGDIQTQINNISTDYNVDINMTKTLTVVGDVSFNNDVKIDGSLTVDTDITSGGYIYQF